LVRRGKRVPMHSSAGSYREFNEDVVVVQMDRVEARRRFFILVTETRRVIVLSIANSRHQQNIAVIRDTRAA
jgi:hypothetical protein